MSLMRTKLAATLAAAAFMVAACSGDGGATVEKDLPADLPKADLAADLRSDLGPDLPEGVPDAQGPDLLFPDVPSIDMEGPACRPGEGCFLDKCDDHEDCLSGWCVEHLGEQVCTVACQDECPPGWSCQQVAGTAPDLVFVCVSDHTNLCRPCSSGNDCKGAVGTEDVCVSYGDEGSFCGGACLSDADCPWGFSCGEAISVDGISTVQCVADAGICPCTETSVKLSLWTTCAVTNEFGTCTGKRVCTAEGLSECDAAAPSIEVCNGVDDDCDGDVDEPILEGGTLVPLCDDGNVCTDDWCDPEEGCGHSNTGPKECADGDICTTADHCQEGVCVGSPVICDDKNPCTDDQCTANGGCESVPNQADCDDGDPCTVSDECAAGECHGFAVNCDCLEDADCEALEDGDLCNGTLVCDTSELPHKCRVDAATVVTCPEAEGPEGICLKPACAPLTGACSLVPDHEGYACSTGDKCIVGLTCQEGECKGGFPLKCDDDNPCTADSCDPAQGCLYVPAPGSCSDADVCTVGDSCQEGQCVPGEPLDCDDDNPCTTDSCDAAVGCKHKPLLAPGESCCLVPADCPPEFSKPLACDDQAGCQGSKQVAVCVNHQCGTTLVEDDSACVGLADACGLFKDIVCSGAKEQAPKACALSCATDADCDSFAWCDGICKADIPIGEPCTADNECESGDCSPAPGNSLWFCTAAMHECALADGTGVHDGFKHCHEGNLWICLAEDQWQETDCADDCGYYLDIDECLGSKCATCPAFCASDADCDANAHCDGECVADLNLGEACDEDSDCASGNCAAAPSGSDFCVPLTDECALDDGSGVDQGVSLCLGGDLATCTAPDTWTTADCADDCGLYADVDGCEDGACQPCAAGCQGDDQCDAAAHCDGECLLDVVDGGACDEPSDCVSGHCQNGFCCANGDCCAKDKDCPLKYVVFPLCDDSATCQGHRVDAQCLANVCGSKMVDDDSGCGGDLLANECGLFNDLFCTGLEEQAPPACPGSCTTDDDCDAGAHCDDGTCLADVGWGEVCDEDSDCAQGLCHNGQCCQQACGTDGCLTGQCDDTGACTSYTSGHHNCPSCQACDGQGQCAPQTADGAGATALGCSAGDEGCRRCDNGACTFYTADQHGCASNHHCNANGQCEENAPDEKIVCFDPYPQDMGHWVSEWCPAGYSHLYHVCGAYGGIDNYSYGPYYQDKYLLHNNSNDHCWCCCDCNAVCVKCVK